MEVSVMGIDATDTELTPPTIMRKITPRARSLLIHGIFTKTATKVGMVATKAAFILVDFLQKEVPIPPLPPSVDRLLGLTESEAKSEKRKNKKLKDAKRLKKIVKRSHEVLVRAKTVFPFTLFPDTITVDRTKVTIHRRDFFFSSDVMSIRIEDILNVSCGVGPLFGSITIASRVMSTEDHFTINFFWRSDAVHLKHILQGYVIAVHNKIDCGHLDKDELLETIIELGHDSNG
jgi:hypothetical protein